MEQFKEPLLRAGWTALEAFLGVIIGSGVLDIEVSTLEAAAMSAVSAALTVILVWVRQKRLSVDSEYET